MSSSAHINKDLLWTLHKIDQILFKYALFFTLELVSMKGGVSRIIPNPILHSIKKKLKLFPLEWKRIASLGMVFHWGNNNIVTLINSSKFFKDENKI